MWLKNDIGFDSWRFDFVKGYGPQFMKDYVGKTVGQETFNVGEYWGDLRFAVKHIVFSRNLIDTGVGEKDPGKGLISF